MVCFSELLKDCKLPRVISRFRRGAFGGMGCGARGGTPETVLRSTVKESQQEGCCQREANHFKNVNSGPVFSIALRGSST